MPNYVCSGASMQCSFGAGSGSLTVVAGQKNHGRESADSVNLFVICNALRHSILKDK